ncbi:MAG: ornithine cyclodeaminase family protein [Gammaproteobacteria bacterium]|nr:ornithine cyclodeaminase family protein [Gammaproteobacteria bacterium]
MRSANLDEIKSALDVPAAIESIEAGFVALSSGAATVPPVGHIGFEAPPGECHIKYGHIHGDAVFVIKIATGFYENPSRGLATGGGMMIVMSAETGEPLSLLDDSGYLTDVRTAIAGCIAARYLAPDAVECIGIVGAGMQARMQLQYLRHVRDCNRVIVWARRGERSAAYRREMADAGYDVRVADSLRDLCDSSNLIVTATASTAPLVRSEWVRPGTHITAMGSDTPGKQELDPLLFARAGVCAVDSLPQCLDHGESGYAVAGGHIAEASLVELGDIIAGKAKGRSNPREITIADLTGVAVQDIQVAKAVWSALRNWA